MPKSLMSTVFQGRAAVESDGAGPAEPEWTLGSAFKRVLLKSESSDYCGVVWKLPELIGSSQADCFCRIYHHQKYYIFCCNRIFDFFLRGWDNEPIEQPE